MQQWNHFILQQYIHIPFTMQQRIRLGLFHIVWVFEEVLYDLGVLLQVHLDLVEVLGVKVDHAHRTLEQVAIVISLNHHLVCARLRPAKTQHNKSTWDTEPESGSKINETQNQRVEAKSTWDTEPESGSKINLRHGTREWKQNQLETQNQRAWHQRKYRDNVLSNQGQESSCVGMGIVENSTVRFGSRFCFYVSVLSRFPKQFINDISWYETMQWNAWLNLPELESSYILAPWSLSLRSEGFWA